MIGANSVVTADIPDFSVVAGTPAIVLKRYDWEKQACKYCPPERLSKPIGHEL